MHTRVYVPPSVRDIRRVSRWVCVRPETIRWWKRHAHKRQRRFLRQLSHRLMLDPELFDEDGLQGLPQPLSTWDLC